MALRRSNAINNDVIKYRIRVKGLRTPDGTISVRALMALLEGLLDCTEKRLRLAVEGVSVQSGRLPAWLMKAVDVRITGLEKGSTIVDVEAPTLGTVIDEQIGQQDFWVTQPDRQDTAFTLLSSSVHDATAENLESDFYDAGVLNSLLGLKSFLKTEAQTVEVLAEGRPREDISLSLREMEKAERLKVRTPASQVVVISGHLDSIKHSKRQFRLALPDGQSILGRIDEEHLGTEDLRQYWGKEVTARGTMHFKPSRRPQLLAANLIRLKQSGEEIFQYVPKVQTEAGFVAEARQNADKDWSSNIWGKWPGEESIDDILRELKE